MHPSTPDAEEIRIQLDVVNMCLHYPTTCSSTHLREEEDHVVGSGSHQHESPLQIVAMEKEAQTRLMQHERFGEGEHRSPDLD
jgi:hypothetical protein